MFLGDDIVPPPKTFSELVNGEDLTFKVEIEAKIKRLKKMDSIPDPMNFDKDMHSFMNEARNEPKDDNDNMEVGEKVKMVDNLVDLFIKGNALRAQKMNQHRIKPSKPKQKKFFTDLIDTNKISKPEMEEPLRDNEMNSLTGTNKNPLLRLLTPNRDDEREKHQLTPPRQEKKLMVEEIVKNPEKYTDDLLQLPQNTQNEVLESLIESSPRNVDTVIKIAPLTVQRNPLLRILEPNNRDKFDRDNLSPPSYKQDPLLKQIAQSPRQYTDDFLQLPQLQQDIITEALKNEDEDFRIESIVPLTTDRNPLKRLLKPNRKDEKDKANLLPPQYRQDPLLRQLMSNPSRYEDDFLQLPLAMQDKILDKLVDEGITNSQLKKLEHKQRNPLLRILNPNFKDKEDKNNFSPPKQRQDPLLRQLRFNLEDYKDDILQLPSRKQDTLLKLLKREGVKSHQISNILPPNSKQNPLLQLLKPNFKDDSIRSNLRVPAKKQDPLLRQLIESPEEYSEDFLELPLMQQDSILKVIENVDDEKSFEADKLVPVELERNPLKRLLEPTRNDEKEKNQFKPPQLRQNPLLRQLAENPLEFQTDILELPTEMKSELLTVLQQNERNHKLSNQLLKLSSGDYPSLKELFLIEDKKTLQEKIAKVIKDKPDIYARIFSKIFNHENVFDFMQTKEELLTMIENDANAVAQSFTELILNTKEATKEPESSTEKLNIPLTTFFESLTKSTTESVITEEPKRIKVLTQIIKRPKEGVVVKNAEFSDDKVKKLKDGIRNKDPSVTTEVVYKTKEGKIIPKHRIKLGNNTSDEIVIMKTNINKIKQLQNLVKTEVVEQEPQNNVEEKGENMEISFPKRLNTIKVHEKPTKIEFQKEDMKINFKPITNTIKVKEEPKEIEEKPIRIQSQKGRQKEKQLEVKPPRIHAQKERQKETKKEIQKPKEDFFTPKVPHPYKEPPKEVQGQLLRFWDDSEIREESKKEENSKG